MRGEWTLQTAKNSGIYLVLMISGKDDDIDFWRNMRLMRESKDIWRNDVDIILILINDAVIVRF